MSVRMGRGVGAILFVLLLCWSQVAWAGPWTKDAGGYYVKLSELFFFAGGYVDAQGNTVEGADFLSATSAVYAEVGFYEGMHLQTFLPYVLARNAFADESRFLNVGGGDALLAIQWSLPVPFLMAVRPEIKVPMYDVGGIDGPLAMQFPAFGDGQVDATLWLSSGFARGPLYAFVELGYRYRSELYIGVGDDRVFADTAVGLGQIGYRLGPAVLALGGQFALPFVVDEVTRGFAGVNLSLFWALSTWIALEASLDALPWARNSAPGTGFSVGMSFRGG